MAEAAVNDDGKVSDVPDVTRDTHASEQSQQTHEQLSMLSLEATGSGRSNQLLLEATGSGRSNQLIDAVSPAQLGGDLAIRRMSRRDSMTKWRDDIEVMDTRLHSTKTSARSLAGGRRPPLMRYSERKKSGVGLEARTDFEVTRLITGECASTLYLYT